MPVLHLALKDLRLLIRDRMALFWVLGFPVIFSLFIGAVVRAGLAGEASPMKVLVVDRAHNATSQRLLEGLARHDRLKLTRTDAELARQSVRHARAVAYFTIPSSYGTTGAPGKFELAFDPARELEASWLEQLLRESLESSTRTAIHAPEFVLVRAPLDSEQLTPRRAEDIVFPLAVLWGLIGCAACFAVSLVSERTRGTYIRLQALPLSRYTVLAGKALSCFLASLGVAVVLTLLASVVFGVQLGSLAKLAAALLATAACFVGITVALSVLGRSEQSVAGAGWATLLVMAMLGGGMVPLSMLPQWLVGVSSISPVKWGIVALEGASWRSFSSAELAVPCAVLLGTGLISFLVGAAVFARSEA